MHQDIFENNGTPLHILNLDTSEVSISVVKCSLVKCSEVLQCNDGTSNDGTSNKVSNIIIRHIDNRKLLLICILLLLHSLIFF